MNKPKILYIAKNIPTPIKDNNKIILTIANKLSIYYDIEIIFPAEIVPFFIRNSKYDYLKRIKSWQANGLTIVPQKYIKLPFKLSEYWLSNLYQWNKKCQQAINNSDLIHAHYLFPDGLMAYKIFKKNHTPYIITIRSHDITRLKKISKTNPDFIHSKISITNAKNIFVFNIGHKRIIDNLYNVSSILIPHGIEPENILDEIQNSKKPIKKLEIVLIKKMVDRETNLNWLYYLKEKLNDKINISIIGNVPEEFKQRNKGIGFYGILERNQIFSILENSDIFILPRSTETFGLVYLEAAAKGNVLIGFKERGVDGTFIDREDSFFVSSKGELLSVVQQLIDNDEKINYFKKRALKKVKTLKWQYILNKYRKYYDSVKV